MIVLGWRRPDPPLVLRWRGPEGVTGAFVPDLPPPALAALIGPPGVAGPPGAQGPPADLANAVIDGGTFN